MEKSGGENPDFLLISATKSAWTGGRPGVKGMTFKFVVRNVKSEKLHFKFFKYGKERIPLKSETKNDIVTLTGIKTDQFEELQVDTESNSKVEKQATPDLPGFLEYTVGNQKNSKIFKISSIKTADDLIDGDALPN